MSVILALTSALPRAVHSPRRLPPEHRTAEAESVGLRALTLKLAVDSFRLPESADTDELVYDLWENGVAGIVEDPDGLRAFFEDGADLAELQNAYATAILETRAERDFQANSVDLGSDPVFAGTRFFIVDPSSTHATPPGRMRLAVEAGGAFGSGRHESTQLVIEALERFLKPADSVIDIGCGSGILLAAAGMLGASLLIGCDIHAAAIETAHRQTGAPLFLGGPDALRGEAANVTIANISASVIDTLAFELNRIAKPSGLILLAGFIEEKTPVHFTPDKVLQKGEWLCWVCRPRAIASAGPVQPFRQQWW